MNCIKGRGFYCIKGNISTKENIDMQKKMINLKSSTNCNKII